MSNVRTMDKMFDNCSNLNQDLSCFVGSLQCLNHDIHVLWMSEASSINHWPHGMLRRMLDQ